MMVHSLKRANLPYQTKHPFSNSALEIFLRSILRSDKILMQNRATLRNALRKRNCELPSVSNDMQSSETLRNSLGLNYKSAALNQLSYAGVPIRKLFSAS